ncbi:spermidine synthase [Pseudocolwellia agarivorans]|uniref:spermidine synthase n=1 Tax=Pseudocolwellia agarivorans TaxID=1911682 RepID=UPI003F880F4F
MDFKKLLTKKHSLLHQQDAGGSVLSVKETADYRWFEYGGEVVQSLMCKAVPEQILTPISQSLLVFLLWRSRPLKVLNLGLGGASLERSLATIPSVLITSVEYSQAVIDMAKRYFNLPKKVHVVCQKAEDFIQQPHNEAYTKYDVVLCDLFLEEKSPEFLFTQDFYFHLNNITNDKAVVMINLQAESDEQLLTALIGIKQHFPYIALIEFDDYKNIVLICSLAEIPNRNILNEQLKNFDQINFTELNKVIKKIRYIPYSG